jgi:uncharacterized protein (TIGR03067 family)
MALVLFVGGLLLPFATFVVLIRFADVSRTSAAIITMAGGFGFAWLLALVLRHAAGKVTAVGAVMLGVLATVVVWQQFSQPTSELDGSWKGVRWEGEDGKRDDLTAVGMRLTIAGDKVKLTTPYGEIDGLITTDVTQNPKALDAGGSKRGGEGDNKWTASFHWVGIYERDGDSLKLCFVEGGKGERPKEFKANPAILFILRRDKQ